MPQLVMYTKPGCSFCWLLRAKLRLARIDVQMVDISHDDEAARVVRVANGGDELTPTVRIGDRYLSNPSLREVRAGLRASDSG